MRFPLKLIILFAFIFPNSLWATHLLDDLKTQIQNTPEKEKPKLYIDLSKKYRKINIDSALFYSRKALHSSENTNSKQNIILSNLELSTNFLIKGNRDSSLNFLENARDLAFKINDSLCIYKVYLVYGGYFYEISEYDSSIYYYSKSLELSKKANDKKTNILNLNGLGAIFWERGDLETALNKYLEAYKIAEDLNDSELKISLLLNMGVIYADEKQTSKAINNYNQVLELAEMENNNTILSVVYNNLAILFQEECNYTKALSYFEKSLDIYKKLGDIQGTALAYNNIGENYFKIGNTGKAIEYLNQSLTINRQNSSDTDIIYNLESLATIYLSTGNYSQAKLFIDEGIELTKKTKIKTKQNDLVLLLSEYYSKTNNFKQAYAVYKDYNKLKDSLFNESRSDRIAQLQTKFETEKKEKENEILRVKNQFTQEKLKQEQSEKKYLIAFSLLAIVLLILIYTLFRSKVKVNQRIKKINSMLEESNQKLKIINATKDKFFSIIAHDLRSPFNSILGFSELIKNEIQGDQDIEQIREYNDSVSESAHSLFSLLENLLQWANSQRGELEFTPTQFDLHELVQTNLSIFNLKALDKSINLISDVQPCTFVYGDVNMINTIVRNLISNALKFTETGGDIHISANTKDKFIIFTVKDTGIGISKENQDKLFRLDCNYTICGTQNETGSGLGLILCKEFVEKNGGHIWVESEPSKGSKFIFTLKSA